MFAYVRGNILHLDGSRATLEIHGIGLGFEIFLSPAAISEAHVGREITLSLHHHITETSQTLFGFFDENEKELFRKLLSVNGVGGKTAQNILGLGRENIMKAIELEDDKLLASVPGIGKKTAQKIIVDLKGSIDFSKKTEKNAGTLGHKNNDSLLISSLVQMGYDKSRVEAVVQTLNPEESLEIRTVGAIRKLAE